MAQRRTANVAQALLLLMVGGILGWWFRSWTTDAEPTPSARAEPVFDLPTAPRPIEPPSPMRNGPPSTRTEPSETSINPDERIRELERQLTAAQHAREPRLGSDRVRQRGELRDAILRQPLRYRNLYLDLLDFIIAPHLIQEHPAEYLECLERAVTVTGAHIAPRESPDSNSRTLSLESGDEGSLCYGRFLPNTPSRRDGVRIALTLPDTLPLPHPAHIAYKAYAEFNPDGTLDRVSLYREQSSQFDLALGTRGEIRATSRTPTSTITRTDEELRLLYDRVGSCIRRLAALGSVRGD